MKKEIYEIRLRNADGSRIKTEAGHYLGELRFCGTKEFCETKQNLFPNAEVVSMQRIFAWGENQWQ